MKLPPLKVAVAFILGLFLCCGFLLVKLYGPDTVAAHAGAAEFYGEWQNTIDGSILNVTVEKEELIVKSGESISRYRLDRDGHSFLDMGPTDAQPTRRIVRNQNGELELSILQVAAGSQQVVTYRRKR